MKPNFDTHGTTGNEISNLGRQIKSKIDFDDYDAFSIVIGVELFLRRRHYNPKDLGIDFTKSRKLIASALSFALGEGLANKFILDPLYENNDYTSYGNLVGRKFLTLQMENPKRCELIASEIADLTATIKQLIG